MMRSAGMATIAGNPIRVVCLSFCANFALFAGNGAAATEIEAGAVSLHITQAGRVTGIRDAGGREYLVAGRETRLLNLVVADGPAEPTEAAEILAPNNGQCMTSDSVCSLEFPYGISAEIAIAERDGYATFELIGLVNPGGKDIRMAMWGPFPVTLYQRVGDILGLAWSRDFAIGVMGLNPKTLAGAPFEYPQFTAVNDIVDPQPLGGESSRTSRNSYFLSAARVTHYGTLLQFYTRDYTEERFFSPYEYWGSTWTMPVQPLPAPWGSLTGSKIAVYGVARTREAEPHENLRDVTADQVLDAIARIEVGEGLPHPLVGGQWAKRSPESRHRYMDFEGLTAQNMGEAADLALSAGLKWIYYRGDSWGVFKHGGGYPIKDVFGGTDESFAAAIERVESRGVRMGTHSVSGFLRSHDDETIRGELPPDLAEQGRATLSRPLTPGSVEIFLHNSGFYDRNAFENRSGYGTSRRFKYIRIGDELIGYVDVEDVGEAEVKLSNLQRGDHGTRAAYHEAGAIVHKLWYLEGWFSAYHAGPSLLRPMAARIAETINNTGLRLYAYDGLESWVRTGHDTLLASQFVLEVYNRLEDKSDFQNEGSVITHFNWHLHNRLNWGELRGSVFTQQQKYRWANQPMFARNLLPNALGSYFATVGDSTVEAQWVGSKVASFDAAFTLQEHIDVFRAKPDHLDAIRRWVEATEAGAFSDEEKFRMRDPDSRFHLEEVVPGRTWRLWDEDPSGHRSNPRIVERPAGGHDIMNIAPSARLRASSEQDKGFPADNAVDEYGGVAEDEFEHNRVSGVSEWATAADDRMRWIELQWDRPHVITGIFLFDRAGLDNDTRAGTIGFDDGASLEIQNIPANGNGHFVSLEERMVASLRFTITSAQGTNPGLAELVVLGRAVNDP